ncbi:MAG: MerR family transcriptional regulator [Paracoccus sp. (in: a-proteobacteria)]|nr:MerR family transcriptional regulator [Paracoccus sp. (in: a-proteobacteria)]
MDCERPKTRIDKLVSEHAAALSERLQAHREQLFPPNAKRVLRKFTSGEVAELLGVKDAYLRKLDLDGRGPSPETRAGGRRYYSPSDIQALRGCCHVKSRIVQVVVLMVSQATLAADFHASKASSRW